ncbi:hypothetical protein [Actinomyces qiguomingii]|uniref:hypothetical protein n=1 Tax=Actinomyces qiguomingii TaxID=2057800 RepID=UPI000CA06E7D|nr:hypothetical protein [Actinomyces qiguomingii]
MTNSLPGAVIGAQTPRLRVAADGASRLDGADAADIAAAYGLELDDWQAMVLSDWLATEPNGLWTHSRCGLSVPRQNGKNAVIEARELYGMAVIGEAFLHTAHEVKTARKAFRRLLTFFDNPRKYPDLAAKVVEIRRTNGQEAIVLDNGGSVEFVARSKGSARGFTVDTIVADEAQDFGEDAMEALRSTNAAGPQQNPQLILTGTPPGPKADGEIFRRFRASALSGSSDTTCWAEWSAPNDADYDDEKTWATANPGYGIRISRDTIMDERGDLSEEGFARERLGMWDEVSTNAVIDAATWLRCADMASNPVDRLALAVDVQPGRESGSVAVAGQRSDGRWHVEVIDNRNNVGWIVDRVAGIYARQRIRTVVIDKRGPAASLVEPLQKKGLKVTTTDAAEMAAACGSFYDAVMEDTLRHLDTPVLNSALAVARKRSLGDAWAWHRKNAAADITPLVACTLALHGAMSDRISQRRSNRATFV